MIKKDKIANNYHEQLLERAEALLTEEEYKLATQLHDNNILEAFIEHKANGGIGKINLPYLNTICYENENEIQFCLVDQEGRTSYQAIDKKYPNEPIEECAVRMKRLVGKYSIYYSGRRINTNVE